MSFAFFKSNYEPGEPYEFMAPLFVDGDSQLRYRCFRGKCMGRAVQTADRNTHNRYHNQLESHG